MTITTSSSSPASHASPRRALVLGGGGSTGNAWLIGVVAGLAEAGIDVTAPDLTIGTSAGSTAAAQLVAGTPHDLYAATLEAPAQQGPSASVRTGPRPSPQPVVDHLDRMARIIAASADATEFRRRVCAAALERDAASDGSFQEQWRATVAARLPGARWPDRTVLITAVDAVTGEPVVFDRDSGVDLVDAVAASCASGLPYRIAGRPYLDGGYRANAENADLAAGSDRVLVLSPFGGRALHPLEWGTHLAAQLDVLRAGGARVETLAPSPDAEYMFGVHAMDPSLRAPAARAGHDEGMARAGAIAELWG